MDRDQMIADRIQELIAARDTNPRAVALAAGLGPTGVRDILIRKTRSPKLATIEKIAAALGVSASDITGVPSAPEVAPPGSALVSVYDVQASAGHGAMVGAETEVHTLAFPPSYLKRLTSSSPANLAIISVKGESMEPTLLDDDIVLLDRSKTNLSYDGLFVLRFDDALHVKRVGRSARRGHVTIISDNSQLYPPMEADRGEIEAVGKVLWYGRKV